jgi:hypothetical protein
MSDKPELELFFSSPDRYEKLTVEIQLDRRLRGRSIGEFVLWTILWRTNRLCVGI